MDWMPSSKLTIDIFQYTCSTVETFLQDLLENIKQMLSFGISNVSEGYVYKNVSEGYVYKNVSEGYVYKNVSEGYVYKNVSEGYVYKNVSEGYVYKNVFLFREQQSPFRCILCSLFGSFRLWTGS